MNRRASDEPAATPGQRGDTGDASKAMLEEEGRKLRETAREAAGAGKERLEAGAGQAAESVDHLSEAVGSAASRLSQTKHESLANYANQLASWLGDMSDKLRSKNVDEITSDVRHLAERNPALFVLGSVALGIGLSRFVKASGNRRGYDSAAGDAEWREEDAARSEFEPEGEAFGPSTAGYEARNSRNSNSADRPSDRPIPDSSGGGGL